MYDNAIDSNANQANQEFIQNLQRNDQFLHNGLCILPVYKDINKAIMGLCRLLSP